MPVVVQAFKGQFICSRDAVDAPAGFITLVQNGWNLHCSPALPVEQCEGGFLLGHALDWTAPEKSNAAILVDLVSDDLGAASSRTTHLAGRWALIFLKGELAVLADGGGTLSIVWNDLHFGSSAKLLAHCDQQIRTKQRPSYDAFRSAGFHSGLAFLATDTECEGVRALLPNHLLLLDSRTVRRFYPSRAIPESHLQESVGVITDIVKGMVKAAAIRSPLAIGLTSGFDSRLIAAAVSAVPEARKRSIFFTIQDEHATPSAHYDIEGAEWIAKTIGLPHSIQEAQTQLEFRELCRKSERHDCFSV